LFKHWISEKTSFLFPRASDDRFSGTQLAAMGYRPDIDGLRAVSVLAVILFHLNGALPGGYIGVDVFFVISGFLIGGIVLGEVNAGNFSFAHFYERRIRRIFPALITTLIVSAIAAFKLMGALELNAFAKSATAALFSAANIYFYATSGYFAATATDVPLLHLWSLGVEEQFYIVFPLIVVLLARFLRSALVPCLAVLGLASLLWSQHELLRHPEAAFYLLQNRAFELTIGILLLSLPRPGFAGLLSLCGVILLAFAIFGFNQKTPFPGIAALLPCIGSALIVWCAAGTMTGKLLGAQPLRYLGKISYPLYLAHWPFIVFGKIALPGMEAGRFAGFVLVGSLLAAAATYHWIERPIRYGSVVRLRWSAMGGAAVFCALIGGMFVAPAFNRLIEFHLSSMDARELFLQGKCFLLPDQDAKAFASDCYPAHRPEVLLWGDSHASDLYTGLKGELATAGYSLGMLASAACPPVLGYKVEGYPFCQDSNDFVASQIETRKPDIVIISAFWKPHHNIKDTLTRLAKVPGISIFVIGNTPVFEESVPTYLGRRSADPIKVTDRSAAELMLQQQLGEGKIEGVKYLSLKNLTCPRGYCPLTDANGYVYYIDNGHLSAEGSRWVAHFIVQEILANRPPS
jgi:peptidoglycan/LPS O-acetylase OafA/YrhL